MRVIGGGDGGVSDFRRTDASFEAEVFIPLVSCLSMTRSEVPYSAEKYVVQSSDFSV